ncbi:hypothetical protein [Nakamurella sp. UYEF19]|uniref:hypothetical protein n=1 Tax=Nakamurella sp. UYEF19 TaxID=1756392 RepID=UPI003395F037
MGCYRETSADLALSMLSLLANPLVGLIKHHRRADRYLQEVRTPTVAPTETWHRINGAFKSELVGVSVHRGLFWRYVATWTAPA